MKADIGVRIKLLQHRYRVRLATVGLVPERDERPLHQYPGSYRKTYRLRLASGSTLHSDMRYHGRGHTEQ